jgi:hypothetical protein
MFAVHMRRVVSVIALNCEARDAVIVGLGREN